jgi:hypothetical protein
VYARVVAELPAEAREELDRALQVDLWLTPDALVARALAPAAVREPGAPSWYGGVEDEGAAWLAGMGVRLEAGAER